jgi:hypothetical protein
MSSTSFSPRGRDLLLQSLADTSQQDRLNRTDYLIVQEEVNWFYQLQNKELYRKYLLYNLNTKPVSFDIFFIILATCVLLPVRILYFIYFDTSSPTNNSSFKALNVVLLLILIIMCFLGWFYIFERKFPKNKVSKKFWQLYQFCSRNRSHIAPEDETDQVSITYPRKGNHKQSSITLHSNNKINNNISSTALNEKNSETSFGHMKNRFLFLQHILILTIMLFNILFFITNSIQVNCTDYGNLLLNHVLRNCETEDDNYVYLLMFTPIIIYCLFRECLFELHCGHQFFITTISILYVSYYQYSLMKIIVIIVWTIGSVCLFLDLHIHNMAAFLTNDQLRRILEEKERNADKLASQEMRHMIGNVAHDLKTVRNIFYYCNVSSYLIYFFFS